MSRYYKGDDFNAFGQEWALVEVDIPEDWIVTKAELRIGNLPKMTFHNPVFPFPGAGYPACLLFRPLQHKLSLRIWM